ncbi:unnamed protein product [Adineta steineri]|uniref:Uncharacterized protein n=1 Tax=Adineta steineri TaxID=433720 RepID=A0A814LNU5_9BILA|nr:unnamed protein product [Adineta steineri]
MDVWWILLILIVRTATEQSESKFMNSGAGLEVSSSTEDIDRKNYRDGGNLTRFVELFYVLKSATFYFMPIIP